MWHNSLTVKTNLVIRDIGIDDMCLSCTSQIEDIQHRFRACPSTLAVWSASSLTQGPNITLDVPIQQWLIT